jgi:hypothetical protein
MKLAIHPLTPERWPDLEVFPEAARYRPRRPVVRRRTG